MTGKQVETNRILVAEDDENIRHTIDVALRFEGYDVEVVQHGAAALESYDSDPHDLVLLDVMMPFVDGLDVCRMIRARGDRTPILMVTARSEVSDRVEGLDAGADDYLIKPFALDELLARVRALLRRSQHAAPDRMLVVGDLRLDRDLRIGFRSDREFELTKTEFDLLEFLMLNADMALGRSQLYEDIWGYDFGTSSKSLAVYVGYLRRKTEADGESRMIQTLRGYGYVLRPT